MRQVSAGGCGACEADCNVLQTIGWDLGRFGVQFAASPRHADGIVLERVIEPTGKVNVKKQIQNSRLKIQD